MMISGRLSITSLLLLVVFTTQLKSNFTPLLPTFDRQLHQGGTRDLAQEGLGALLLARCSEGTKTASTVARREPSPEPPHFSRAETNPVLVLAMFLLVLLSSCFRASKAG